MGALKLQPALDDRFLSQDPLGITSNDLNPYRYVWNNPNASTDPSGKYGVPGAIFGGVTGFVGGFVGGYTSSGGNIWVASVGAIAGGAVGAFVGAVAPQDSGVAGAFVGGFLANTLAQAGGSEFATGSPIANFDPVQPFVAGAAAAAGAPLVAAIGNPFVAGVATGLVEGGAGAALNSAATSIFGPGGFTPFNGAPNSCQ